MNQNIAAAPRGIWHGAFFMLAAALSFASVATLVRYLSQSLDPLVLVFFRNFFAVVFLLPWLFKTGLQVLKTARPGGHVLRAAMGLLYVQTWYFALSLLPLAEAVALNFVVPMFATAGAALFLGEAVKLRRWSAVAIGFAGTLVILRPGFTDLTPAMTLPVIAAALMAGSALVGKSLVSQDSPFTIVFYVVLAMTPLSLIPALFVWQWPTPGEFALLALLGIAAMAAHLFMTMAFARADASAVMPFDYTRLPFVAAFGFLVFGEVPDLWTWVGAAIIAGAAFYIARREGQLARGKT